MSILNAQRRDANQNNHIQLAEFFTSDYESSRTTKEHACIQVCLRLCDSMLPVSFSGLARSPRHSRMYIFVRPQACFSSFERLLEDTNSGPLFRSFLDKLPQGNRPQKNCRPILEFHAGMTAFCEDLKHKRKSVDQLWIAFESLGLGFLKPRQLEVRSFSLLALQPFAISWCDQCSCGPSLVFSLHRRHHE